MIIFLVFKYLVCAKQHTECIQIHRDSFLWQISAQKHQIWAQRGHICEETSHYGARLSTLPNFEIHFSFVYYLAKLLITFGVFVA